MKEFGSLKRIDLREIWRKEPTEFTTWLAQNLSALGKALGMDLELVGRESQVGDFSLDILARDLGAGRVVVIENQLERTDHDHLGKLITYAAGNNAGVVIWVTKQVREEHRQAIDWLNQHTDSEIEFYAVMVEVVQVDDSRPAFDFKPVAFPNPWRKGKIATGMSSPPTERGEAYKEFFQQLIDELREVHKFTGAKQARAQNWYCFASGFGGLRYCFSFAQGARFRVELYISKEGERSKDIFDSLNQTRESIEAQFGEALEWERLDGKTACRIAIYRNGSIDDTPQGLDEIKTWAIQRILKFKRVFEPYLAKVAG